MNLFIYYYIYIIINIIIIHNKLYPQYLPQFLVNSCWLTCPQIFKDLIFIKLIDNTIASLWILPIISPCNKDVGLNHSWAVITSNVGISISTCPLSNGVCLGVSRIITLHLKWSSKTNRYLELCFITGWHFCFTCEKDQNVYVLARNRF